MLAQQLGHAALDEMRCARPSTTAVLPTPGSPISTGLFFMRRERICITRSISFWRPTTGSSLPSRGQLRQVAAELVEQLGALLGLGRGAGPAVDPAAALRARAAARAGQHADDLVADLLGVGVEVEQDARGDTLVLAHEAEQDVLGADVVVPERERLAQRQLEHLLGPRRERDLAGRDLVALADDARDLRAHLLDRDVERVEHARGEALLLAQQPEQDVLGADVVVLEGAGLVLCKDDDLAGALGESLEHKLLRTLPEAPWRARGTPRALLRSASAAPVRSLRRPEGGVSQSARGRDEVAVDVARTEAELRIKRLRRGVFRLGLQDRPPRAAVARPRRRAAR